jgi:hypothetical protein
MSDAWRERVAAILEIIARDRLPNPHDLDVALDAIECEVSELVEAARREEREACARVADTHAKPAPHARVFTHEEALRAEGYEDAGHDIAAAIRARGDA